MMTINCKGTVISFDVPKVMGIINITPDSFYSGSRQISQDQLLRTVETMLEDGATFLDVGGQSTRPGSERLPEKEEAARVIPAIKTILKRFPAALISVDTYYSGVAREAVAAGACLVNDVSAGTLDAEMISTIAKMQVPYVLMHMQGTPQTMQKAPAYQNVVLEVFDSLNFKKSELHKAGINDVLIDVGFGFGKTAAHNFELLNSLNYFKNLACPLLVGLSRKGTVYKTLHTTAENALNGSTVLHTIALLNGASLLRVHDVKEAVEAVTLVQKVMQKG